VAAAGFVTADRRVETSGGEERTMAAKPAAVDAKAGELIHSVQDAVGTALSDAVERARTAVDDATHQYLERLPAIERDLTSRAQHVEQRLERKATKLSKKLPVDTPLDRRRRRRNRQRGGSVAVLVVGLGGVAAYVAWRVRRRGSPSPAEQPLDPRDLDAAGPEAPARDGDAAARGAGTR
jgi:hypothetical protein